MPFLYILGMALLFRLPVLFHHPGQSSLTPSTMAGGLVEFTLPSASIISHSPPQKWFSLAIQAKPNSTERPKVCSILCSCGRLLLYMIFNSAILCLEEVFSLLAIFARTGFLKHRISLYFFVFLYCQASPSLLPTIVDSPLNSKIDLVHFLYAVAFVATFSIDFSTGISAGSQDPLRRGMAMLLCIVNFMAMSTYTLHRYEQRKGRGKKSISRLVVEPCFDCVDASCMIMHLLTWSWLCYPFRFADCIGCRCTLRSATCRSPRRATYSGRARVAP